MKIASPIRIGCHAQNLLLREWDAVVWKGRTKALEAVNTIRNGASELDKLLATARAQWQGGQYDSTGTWFGHLTGKTGPERVKSNLQGEQGKGENVR